MKIILVGATGTVGQAVHEELGRRHEIVSVAHTHGDIQLDMTDVHSIEAMYKKVGAFDALIATAGQVHFGPLSEFDHAKYQIGINSKLMGQVNLVLLGMKYIRDQGSFTLTSGILTHDPIRFGSSASMVNGAIESFAKSAAIELPRGLRINVVSPSVLTESLPSYGPYFYGFESVPAERVARAYSKSVEGAQTGLIYKVN